jgi:hypothetical protein
VRSEHCEAPLVDKLAVCVDDRLDRTLREPLYFLVDDLDRPVDHSLFHRLAEDQLEGVGQVLLHLLRVELRQLEVHEIAELDRLCGALV